MKIFLGGNPYSTDFPYLVHRLQNGFYITETLKACFFGKTREEAIQALIDEALNR